MIVSLLAFGFLPFFFIGKGLGKEESGISKAIKVNIKTDTAGVRHSYQLSLVTIFSSSLICLVRIL